VDNCVVPAPQHAKRAAAAGTATTALEANAVLYELDKEKAVPATKF
jgi:hypothetical protein